MLYGTYRYGTCWQSVIFPYEVVRVKDLEGRAQVPGLREPGYDGGDAQDHAVLLLQVQIIFLGDL